KAGDERGFSLALRQVHADNPVGWPDLTVGDQCGFSCSRGLFGFALPAVERQLKRRSEVIGKLDDSLLLAGVVETLACCGGDGDMPALSQAQALEAFEESAFVD